ncbi:hypothetical protein Poli38472_011563 [Pythium oligandrum]|uniref:EF-hand domain-containing protein n=1 Tax=Pythium oligandrum TaxID=41045 RepID=A0A8K1CKK7_PYTOL|nr:hypothetical protein Poli38472_011563 [Pythium oligandrum]|eukprot:TMW64683.1 hypothetical protein Poli38472_011563 [Pythium oligandrum]
MTSSSWVATRIALCGLTGLASSHSRPFLRVLYRDKTGSASHHRPKDQQVICQHLPEDEVAPIIRREATGEYTAHWTKHEEYYCVLFVPANTEWLEVQLWNRFEHDVAVFLGTTQIDLKALVKNQHHATLDEQKMMATRWYPLESTKEIRTRLRLSVQLDISPVHDENARRIQQKIASRKLKIANKEDKPAIEPGMVDPSFIFSEPKYRIEWSSIVSANLRRIFLQGDVDALTLFYNDVLYGGMTREIEEDESIHVDEGYLASFRLCQLSAQYLAHCAHTLEDRKREYQEQSDFMLSKRRNLRARRRELVEYKRRLQKEHDDLALLVSTYEKLSAKQPAHPAGVDIPTVVSSSPFKPVDTRFSSEYGAGSPPPASPLGSVVSKKPAFLMTWEEREEVRRQQKEQDKARRIEEEKQRLQRIFRDRQDRERYEHGLESLLTLRQQRSARILQRAMRQFIKTRRRTRNEREILAATLIHTQVRRYQCQQKWSQRRVQLLEAREQRQMAMSELETIAFMHAHPDPILLNPPPMSPGPFSDSETGLQSPRVPTNALVALWRRLRRIFLLACEQGASPQVLFARLDARNDGVVDRAEFRLGLRQFGARVDRKMTRALIALLRARCDEPFRPLSLTLDQFVGGFGLVGGSDIISTAQLPTAETAYKVQDHEMTDHDTTSQERSSALREESKETKDESSDEEEGGGDMSQRIEDVAHAVTQLRTRVLEAARDHLVAKHESVTDYYAFRKALTHIFDEFDVDQNGELDLDELVDCMASINFTVTDENLAILRECFVSDPTSETVSIQEFISFALSGSDNATGSKASDQELGILGFRLRDAILGKVKAARRHTESIDDAVRWVFKAAYRTPKQLTCTRRDFVRVLARLQIGFTPAQLSRLVHRLDQNADDEISFDELLIWLRLQKPGHQEKKSGIATTDSTTKSSASSFTRAKLVRQALQELAEVSSEKFTRARAVARLTQLFERIDQNGSGKISVEELESFFHTVNLREVPSFSCEMDLSPRELAQITMQTIDLNGNGVVTLDEWTNLLAPDGKGDELTEQAVVVENVRQLLRTGEFTDHEKLLSWFRGLSGVVPINAQHTVEKKLRVSEFK